MWSQKIFIVLIISAVTAISTTEFQEVKFWNRQNGDNLVYTRTKVSVPSQENRYHQVVFKWDDPTKRVTQVVLECNGNCEALVIGGRYSSKLMVYAMATESRQVIATAFIYALTVDNGALNPELQ